MNNQQPEKSGIKSILRDAVNYWTVTLHIQIVFSILYFSMVFLLSYYFFNYYNLQPEFLRLVKLSETDLELAKVGIKKWSADANFANFMVVFVIIRAVMFPLNIGLFNIYKKIDQKEEYSLADLYEGFRGFNFFKFLGFAVFWGFINLYAHLSFVLIVIWILITIFSAPLMYFKNVTIFESIRMSIGVIKKDFITIVVCCLLGFLLSYFGLIFFIAGVLVTFSFWNAMVYSLYKNYFSEMKTEVVH